MTNPETKLCTIALWLASALAAACGASVNPAGDGGSDALQTESSAPGDAGGCLLGNGVFCPADTSCLAPDGCNHCRCSAGGGAACTELGCVPPMQDAGLAAGRCRTSQDCAAGREECRFELGVCATGQTGFCSALTDCAPRQPFCSCEGRTFVDCDTMRTTQPAAARGACMSSSDAGGG